MSRWLWTHQETAALQMTIGRTQATSIYMTSTQVRHSLGPFTLLYCRTRSRSRDKANSVATVHLSISNSTEAAHNTRGDTITGCTAHPPPHVRPNFQPLTVYAH